MNIDLHNKLNEVYGPIYGRAKDIYLEMFSTGQNTMFSWQNMHSKMIDGQKQAQFYPIAVITIENVGDIGVDADSVFFEVKVSREKALKLDYEGLKDKYDIQVTGQNNSEKKLYEEGLTSENVFQNISETDEENIVIFVMFPENVRVLELMELWETLVCSEENKDELVEEEISETIVD